MPLSGREREIANLVASGLTNRQIAERLVVSVRTVEGHLYLVFKQLGINERERLIRLMRNADPDTPANGGKTPGSQPESAAGRPLTTSRFRVARDGKIAGP
ncbi:helix-turn-helix domain-containing protein [Mycolicibacterium sarraceniae]|uniref:HTH luxR-type domain-containing protein n=1 Tax=Mycolicibacterium sarraceniae TaxID=1534348 RepID=A0A7I7SJK2_9MYCO|nr:helix-turn-helix transcriptional regulator [Mycolicibacterium sarraceniae]BBY57127.1 hypothetical protein MSAR_02630 [Mycolicibacterium sarraceniae]